MFTEDFFGGFFGIGIVFPLAFLAIVALAIVAVATGRSEPDPDGRRAYGLYLSVVGVLAILIALFAATDAAGNVISALVEEDEDNASPVPVQEPFLDEEFGFEGGPFAGDSNASGFDPDDERYAGAVRSGLLAAVAVGVYWLHRRRIQDIEEEASGRAGPAWRVHYGYLLAVALLGVVVVLVATADALYGVFRSVAPGITGFGDDRFERRQGLTQLLRSGVLALAAAGVYRAHWERSLGVATPAPPSPVGPPASPPGEGPEPASPPS